MATLQLACTADRWQLCPAFVCVRVSSLAVLVAITVNLHLAAAAAATRSMTATVIAAVHHKADALLWLLSKGAQQWRGVRREV